MRMFAIALAASRGPFAVWDFGGAGLQHHDAGPFSNVVYRTLFSASIT